MLRSQDGVEDVENTYGNLKEGLIRVKAKKDKAIDVGRLVQLLEKDVGFEPLTQVTLEMRGRLARREARLFFEVSDTGQVFAVQAGRAGEPGPPEQVPLAAVATLADPQSTERIILGKWETEPLPEEEKRKEPVTRKETAEMVVSGMTCGGCAGAVRAALLKVEGVLQAEVDFGRRLARVTYDPGKVHPDRLPEALKGTPYSASLRSKEAK